MRPPCESTWCFFVERLNWVFMTPSEIETFLFFVFTFTLYTQTGFLSPVCIQDEEQGLKTENKVATNKDRQIFGGIAHMKRHIGHVSPWSLHMSFYSRVVAILPSRTLPGNVGQIPIWILGWSWNNIPVKQTNLNPNHLIQRAVIGWCNVVNVFTSILCITQTLNLKPYWFPAGYQHMLCFGWWFACVSARLFN